MSIESQVDGTGQEWGEALDEDSFEADQFTPQQDRERRNFISYVLMYRGIDEISQADTMPPEEVDVTLHYYSEMCDASGNIIGPKKPSLLVRRQGREMLEYIYAGMSRHEMIADETNTVLNGRQYGDRMEATLQLICKGYEVTADADAYRSKAKRQPRRLLTSIYGYDLTEPLLSAGEEVELAKRIEAGRFAGSIIMQAECGKETLEYSQKNELERQKEEGQGAYERFVNANLRLALYFMRIRRATIRQLATAAEIMPEVVTNGIEPAVQRFDYTRGTKFSTYAKYWIRKAINDALSIRQPIPVTAHIYNDMLMVRNTVEELQASGQSKTVTDSEVKAVHSHLALKKIAELRLLHTQLKGFKRLDSQLGKDGDDTQTFHDTVANPLDEPVEDAVGRIIRHEALHAAAMRLEGQERLVVELSSGLFGTEMSDEEIAKRLNKSTVGRVRQLRTSAYAKLREAMQGYDED
jgi:RNA polymerase primary sigma factor